MPPLYDFKALSSDGKPKKGIIEAENQKAARGKLKKQGLMPTDIIEKSAMRAVPGGSRTSGPSFLEGGISVNDIALMTRQLASLVKANIPLVECLNALVEQIEKEKLKVVLAQVRQEVNEGISLAKALAKHPKTFDTIFVNMVEAGESSGTLGLVLLKLADLKEGQMRLKNKLISGMTYPALMMGVAVIMVLVIFTFVIPQLAKIFESMNKPLPASTKFLIGLSNLLVNYWFIIVGALAFFLVVFLRYIKTPGGKAKWDVFLLGLPVLGQLIRVSAVTRFSGAMGTLLGSGVPILTAMNISKNLVGSTPIAKAVADARENITEGQSIAEPLRRSGEFPPLVLHMIAIGEKTGELPQMLQNVASTYEEQVNSKIESLTALLEPLMIVGMGVVIGFIVMSIFVPLLEMSNIK